MVAVRSRVFASDEELGKRDDDRRPSKMGTWNIKHKPTWRKRRIVIVVLACVGLWLFVHYIPTDLGPVDRQTGQHMTDPMSRIYPQPEVEKPRENVQQPPGEPPVEEEQAPLPHNYDGPIRFYYLASTLRAAERAKNLEIGDKNVLFAASNLNSAGAIIPMACEMAGWSRNTVHMAIMGRSEFSIEEIQNMHGASKESCNIWWHDARPDFVATSTDSRMEASVAGAVGHISSFVHPVVAITADLESEDVFFAHGMERKLHQSDMTHIKVPKESPESLAWAARLDATSLRAWHSAAIDILVQAPLESSGSLIRLLKSLAVADYSGFNPPRLILELPHEMDTSTMNFLSRFRWPPPRYALPGQNEQLTIRRRIFEQKQSVDEASQRFIEAFYPSSPRGPHVLLLSPQTELSPAYFHYLKLSVLEYRHSSKVTDVERSLFGISLESPSVHLDGTTPFEPLLSTKSTSSTVGDVRPVPFRWQAPNTNAALYFGDKWMEVHSFLKRRYAASRHPSLRDHYQSEKKAVSPNSPAWAEYFLQLMLARGYFLHYPGVQLASSLAIVHNELYQIPEEFTSLKEEIRHADPPPSTDSILTVKDDYLQSHHPLPSQQRTLNAEFPLAQKVESILPLLSPVETYADKDDDGLVQDDLSNAHGRHTVAQPAMPRLSTLPILDHLGKETTLQKLEATGDFSRLLFRASAGGCSKEQSKSKKVVQYSAVDLFCFDQHETQDQLPVQLSREETEKLASEEYDDEDVEVSTDDEPPVGEDKDQTVQPADNPIISAGAEGPPGAIDAEKFQELARESMRNLEAAGHIPGDIEAPPTPEVLAGNTPVAEAQPVGPGDPQEPSFPILDAKDIKAFDEGREADRNAPKAGGGGDQPMPDSVSGGDAAKGP